jgi:hypothetical protein
MWTNFFCICVFLFLEDGIVMVIFGFNNIWRLELSRFLDLWSVNGFYTMVWNMQVMGHMKQWYMKEC